MKRALIGLMLAFAAPAMAAPQTPTASARAFVEGIYRPWIAAVKRGSNTYQPKSDASLYAPELAALLQKDQRISNRTGDVGVIDWAILCSCQDDGGLGYTITAVTATTTSGIARVALSFGGKYSTTLTLKLVRTRQGWRIADVADNEMPSLLAMLRRELAGKR